MHDIRRFQPPPSRERRPGGTPGEPRPARYATRLTGWRRRRPSPGSCAAMTVGRRGPTRRTALVHSAPVRSRRFRIVDIVETHVPSG